MAQYLRKTAKTARQFLPWNCHEKVLVAFGIIERFQSPESTIPMQADSTLLSRMKNYPIVLKSIATVIYLLGKQGFAFRGQRESIYRYEKKAENDKEEDNVSGNKHAESKNSPIMSIAGSKSEISNQEKRHLFQSKNAKRND